MDLVHEIMKKQFPHITKIIGNYYKYGGMENEIFVIISATVEGGMIKLHSRTIGGSYRDYILIDPRDPNMLDKFSEYIKSSIPDYSTTETNQSSNKEFKEESLTKLYQ